MAQGAGYEITREEVCAARDRSLAADQNLEQLAQGHTQGATRRIAEYVAGPAPAARWVRQRLGLPLVD